MKRILLLCLTAVFTLVNAELWAQERSVSGRVTSPEDGSSLPGVNVVLKGTTNGTVTDADGNYRLTVPQSGGVLVFSFIGFQSQEVEIGTRSTVDVVLATDITELSEVVVTAFGIERPKDELTYSAQSVKGSDLVIAQQTRAAQGLVGKVAGLQINIQNNGVNPSNQILLRGLRSITSNNSALIVIDGSIATQGAFDALNPNDIESINVLKGANAAALYGSDAGNGALVVVTKGGATKNEKFTVGINSTFRMEQVAYMPTFQTEYGLGWAGNYDPIENTNWGPRYDGVTRRIGPVLEDGTFQEVPYAPIKDNLKDFYETGKTSQNTVYFQGGNKNSSFYFSAGNQHTTGVIPDDKYERSTFRLNASQKIGKLKLSLNSSYMKDETNIVGDEIGDQSRPFYWFILNTAGNIPLTRYKDWSNPKSWGYADNYYNAYYQNPYWAIGTNRDTDKSSRLNGNVAVAYDITENINWTTRLGVNTASGYGKEWRARQEYSEITQPAAGVVTSFVEDTEFNRTDFNGQTIATGQFKFQEDFSLTAILGGSFAQTDYRQSTMRASNLSIPGFYDVSNGTGAVGVGVDEQQRRSFGLFTDLTAGYRNWVFLNVTGRQDWTSTLKKGDNSYFYPSAGLSIVLSEGIDAIKNSNVLSYAKIGISNSTVYNDLAPYQINERFVVPSGANGQPVFPLANSGGYALSSTTVDANIQKEKLNTTEIMGSFGFLQGRVNLEAAWFKTKTTDLITTTTPSYASGATGFLTNIGELEASGKEVTLSGTILSTGDFKWTANVNYTSNETVIKEIKDDIKEVALDLYAGGVGTYAIVGEAFPQIKATAYTRDPQGRVVVGSDGNPIVGEVLPMGKTTPDYIIGATSTFTWKGVSLAATIDYRTGHIYYEQGSDQMEFTGKSMASVSSNRQDFVWPNSVIETSEGVYTPNTNLPITGGQMLFWQNTYNDIKENYVKDATAFKIREIAVGYDFPKSLLSQTKVINKAALRFVATNVFTWLPEENRFADPEFMNASAGVGSAAFNANSIGVGGYLQGPPTRTYGFNLVLEF